MSVLGSQVEIDIDPEGEATIMPRHTGNTGTGCFKLHDHRVVETKHRKGPNPLPGPDLIIGEDGTGFDGTALEGCVNALDNPG